MYAIAYKEGPRSSWRMESKVYDDREKVDAVLAHYEDSGVYHAVRRVYFDPDAS